MFGGLVYKVQVLKVEVSDTGFKPFILQEAAPDFGFPPNSGFSVPGVGFTVTLCLNPSYMLQYGFFSHLPDV